MISKRLMMSIICDDCGVKANYLSRPDEPQGCEWNAKSDGWDFQIDKPEAKVRCRVCKWRVFDIEPDITLEDAMRVRQRETKKKSS